MNSRASPFNLLIFIETDDSRLEFTKYLTSKNKNLAYQTTPFQYQIIFSPCIFFQRWQAIF